MVRQNEEEYHFGENEFREFCVNANIKKMEEHIKQLADMRHSLLYASDAGTIVEVKVDLAFFDQRRQWVFFLLALYLMIDSYKEHQLFVSHAVSVFYEMTQYVVHREVGLES